MKTIYALLGVVAIVVFLIFISNSTPIWLNLFDLWKGLPVIPRTVLCMPLICVIVICSGFLVVFIIKRGE